MTRGPRAARDRGSLLLIGALAVTVGCDRPDAHVETTAPRVVEDGCRRASDVEPTEPHEIALEIGGRRRTAWVVLGPLAPVETRAPLPLVVGLHGHSGTGRAVVGMMGLHDDPAHPVIGLYPDGVAQDWYDDAVGWDTRTAQNDDVRFLDAAIAWVRSHRCVRSERIELVGWSWGGWMANHLACAEPGRFHSVVSVSGGGPTVTCIAPTSALIAHGRADVVEPLHEAEATHARYVELDRCASATVPFDPAPCVQHTGCTAGTSLVYCEHERGHEWPPFFTDGVVRRWLRRDDR